MSAVHPIVTNKNESLSDWPEAWHMPHDANNLKAVNRMVPNVPASATELQSLGISHWKVGTDAFTSPVQNVPWTYDEINGGGPPKSCRDYSYANIITLNSEAFEEFDCECEDECEHGNEICYVLVGSGYLDVRCKDDNWTRLHVKRGDLVTLPEEIYHRFTADEEDKIEDVRYFAGQPFWTPLIRVVLEKTRDRRSSPSRNPASLGTHNSTTVC